MKGLVLILGVIGTLWACSSNDDSDSDNSPNDNGNSADQVSAAMEEGTWRITYFFDTDQEETDDFAGYVFEFKADGSLIATKGGNTVEGTWSVQDSSSNDSNDDDGNSTDDDDFNIFFPVPATSDFEDLNDDWDILTFSSSKIELTDVSGGNGGTDFLTFEKN
jgi:hypothetical protein